MQRRKPKQERSERRIEELLDAAEAVFLERGFHGATTNHIVAAAQTSVGALYRFFPNKEVILAAIAERYVSRLEDVRTVLAAKSRGKRSIAQIVSDRVDAYRELFATAPIIRVLVDEWSANARVRALFGAFHDDQRREIEDLIASLGRVGDRAQVEAMAGVVARTLSTLHSMALTQSGEAAERTIAETKRLLTLYLSDSPTK